MGDFAGLTFTMDDGEMVECELLFEGQHVELPPMSLYDFGRLAQHMVNAYNKLYWLGQEQRRTAARTLHDVEAFLRPRPEGCSDDAGT